MVTADFPPSVGGMQAYSWELARAWSKLAQRVTVIAPKQTNSEATDREADSAGIDVLRVPYAKDSFAFSGTPSIAKTIATLKPDAIFATSWTCAAGSQQARALVRAKTPVFAAAHGRELIIRPLAGVPVLPLQSLYDSLRIDALHRCRALFPVSHYTAGLLHEHGVTADRIDVVPNGVDPERYYPKDASALRSELGLTGKRVLLTIGRLVERKGIDTVLAALPALSRAHADLVYVIVGDGPDKARIESLVAEHGVQAQVRMLGRVPFDRLLDYYNLCDVFVMPSRSDEHDVEGFGIVFVEASACGKPVVGARSGGVTDAVIDNETGFLVPPNDADALGQKLGELLRDPQKAQEMGARGRAHVIAHGTWQQAAQRIYDGMRSRLG